MARGMVWVNYGEFSHRALLGRALDIAPSLIILFSKTLYFEYVLHNQIH